MPRRLKITSNMDKWVIAARRYSKVAIRLAEIDAAKAVQMTFDASQDRVHIITESLKLSGRWQVSATKTTVRAEIIYGGPSLGPNNPVDYAEFERARGGSHDFITPAIVATENEYPEGLARTLLGAVKGTFGGA